MGGDSRKHVGRWGGKGRRANAGTLNQARNGSRPGGVGEASTPIHCRQSSWAERGRSQAEDKWSELPRLWVRAGGLRVPGRSTNSCTYHLKEPTPLRALERTGAHREVTSSQPHDSEQRSWAHSCPDRSGPEGLFTSPFYSLTHLLQSPPSHQSGTAPPHPGPPAFATALEAEDSTPQRWM